MIRQSSSTSVTASSDKDTGESVQKVKEAFERAEEAQAESFERLRRYYSLYRAQPDPSRTPVATRAQYEVPLTYKTVETVLPRIVSILFSTSPPIQSRFRVAPPQPGNELSLRALDQLFEWTFDRKRLFWTIEAWIKESLIYGSAFLKVGWKQRKNTKKKVTVLSTEGEIQTSEGEEEAVVEDFLDVQLVSIFDLFFSPDARFPDPVGAGKYLIHRSRQRRSEVLAKKDAGLYGPQGGGDDFTEDDLTYQEIQQNDPQQQLQNQMARAYEVRQDRDDPIVTVYEYWEDERVIATCDHKVLLRDEPNPFGLPTQPKQKPFIACFDNIMAGELFQIGEVEPLEHTQIEMSTLRRQRTDNNSLIINKGWIVNKNAEVDIASLSLARPGMVVTAAPLDGNLSSAVIPLPQQDLNGASYKEIEDLNKDGQEISGLLDYAVGASPERKETATTVQLLQTAANLRFDIKVRNYSQAFQELGYMMFSRFKQLLTTPIPLRVMMPGAVSPTFVEVTKDILPEYEQIDLVCPGSPGMLLKDARNQKMLQYAQMLAQTSPQAAQMMLILALKEAEIDGIEPILALLEQPPGMIPGMGGMAPGMPPPQNGLPGPPPVPMPPRPEGAQGPKMANELPMGPPMPAPNR